MSQTIHSVPRANLPTPSHKQMVKALTMLQDSTSFEQARDVLLRYYYPLLRTWTPSTDKDIMAFNDERSLYATNSSDTHSAAAFLQMQKRHLNMSIDDAQSFSDLIHTSRNNTEVTPYERVGMVYQWLRQWKKDTHSHWDHRNLRDWMERLLMDFTLHDAKHTAGPLLERPDETYNDICNQWRSESHGVPWSDAWTLGANESYALTKTVPEKHFEEVVTDYVNHRQAVRKHIFETMPPVFAIFTNNTLGFNPAHKFSWRTASDYCVLHSLLTQTSNTFNKDVWMDWLSSRGSSWSKPEYASIWAQWQDKGFESFHRMMQTHYEVTPKAITSLYSAASPGTVHQPISHGVNLNTPVPLNWKNIFISWVTTYPYLNCDTEINKYAKKLLSDADYLEYVSHTEQRVGRQVIDAVLEIPEHLRDRDVFNIPGWFYYYVETVTHQPGGLKYELPSNVLDDDLNSAVVTKNI